jgi:hypothetical protein
MGGTRVVSGSRTAPFCIPWNALISSSMRFCMSTIACAMLALAAAPLRASAIGSPPQCAVRALLRWFVAWHRVEGPKRSAERRCLW